MCEDGVGGHQIQGRIGKGEVGDGCAHEALDAVTEVAIEPGDVVGIEVGAKEVPGGFQGAVVP